MAKKKTWFTLLNAGVKHVVLNITGEIGSYGVTAEDLRTELKFYDNMDVELNVYSEGGNVIEGLACYNVIKAHKGKVTGIVNPLAASIAVYILTACDVVKGAENARIMIHKPTMGVGGDAGEIRAQLKLIEDAQDTIIKAYANKTGKEEQFFIDLMDSGDVWLNANEAVEMGLIDELINSTELSNLNKSLNNKNNVDFNPDYDRKEKIKEVFSMVDNKSNYSYLLNLCLDDASCTEANARYLLLNEIGNSSATGKVQNNITKSPIGSMMMNKSKVYLLVNSLTSRVGASTLENGNVYKNKSLLDIAAICVGGNSHLYDKRELVNRAFNTSDFGEVITNTIQAVINEEIALQEPLFKRLANIENMPDFREKDLITINDAPDLLLVSEDAEYKQAVISSTGEKIKLATFGREIRVTREAVINDNIDLIGKIPRKMVQAAFRLADKLMFSAILSGKMGDKDSVFNSTNSTNDIPNGDYQALVMACYSKIAKQKTKEGSPLSLKGDILIANIDHGAVLDAVINTPSKPDSFNQAYKKFNEVVSTDYLEKLNGAIGLTSRDFESIVMGFLDGNDSPLLETKEGWGTDGASFRITYDLSAKVVDRRGMAMGSFKA